MKAFCSPEKGAFQKEKLARKPAGSSPSHFSGGKRTRCL